MCPYIFIHIHMYEYDFTLRENIPINVPYISSLVFIYFSFIYHFLFSPQKTESVGYLCSWNLTYLYIQSDTNFCKVVDFFSGRIQHVLCDTDSTQLSTNHSLTGKNCIQSSNPCIQLEKSDDNAVTLFRSLFYIIETLKPLAGLKTLPLLYSGLRLYILSA